MSIFDKKLWCRDRVTCSRWFKGRVRIWNLSTQANSCSSHCLSYVAAYLFVCFVALVFGQVARLTELSPTREQTQAPSFGSTRVVAPGPPRKSLVIFLMHSFHPHWSQEFSHYTDCTFWILIFLCWAPLCPCLLEERAFICLTYCK